MSAELAARRTAAAAVLGDFRREDDAFIDDDSYTRPLPNYGRWASRLAVELHSVLMQLDIEKPDQAAGKLAQVRHVLCLALNDDRADHLQALVQIWEIVNGGQQ